MYVHPIPKLRRIRTSPARGTDWVRTAVSTAMDATMMKAVQVVVDRALIPAKSDIEDLRDSAHGLLDDALLRNPRQFFAFVDEPATLPRPATSHRRRMLRGGAIHKRRLVADYEPYTPEARHGASTSRPHHDEILFEHWVHEDGPTRGTVIALHGFAMGRPGIGAVALFARQWFERGLDVALVTLPEHGARMPGDARFSGECFAVPHVAKVSEAVREAIHEIFMVKAWLRSQSEAPVGLLGLSLGGYLTALAAGLSDDFDFVIPMVAPACMGDLAWRVFRGTRHGGRRGAALMDESQLRACFRVHSPLAHPLRVPKDRVLIVAGRGDRVVPPEHPTALWEHWGEPAIHWFSGSHIVPFGRGGVVDVITGHLRRLEIL